MEIRKLTITPFLKHAKPFIIKNPNTEIATQFICEHFKMSPCQQNPKIPPPIRKILKELVIEYGVNPSTFVMKK